MMGRDSHLGCVQLDDRERLAVFHFAADGALAGGASGAGFPKC
jgi:hypothetical protein